MAATKQINPSSAGSPAQPSAAVRALTADAAFCAVTGTVMTLFNAPLAGLTGIPATALLVVGVVTAASGALMAYLLRMTDLPQRLDRLRLAVKAALAVNVVWVVASVVILLSGILPLTGTGVAAIIAVALAVEGLSIAEWRALR